ncbi:protein FAM221B [Gastrophryne carolinensis]
MNRHNFPSRVQEMFRSEVEAARRALQSGIYIGWRCPEYQWDCIRVGEGSRCFCGHQLTQHQNHQGGGAKVNCTAESCPCPAFSFIPSSPEEVGEFWLRKRPGFDPGAWAAKCRCHHSHYEHRPTGSRACRSRGCGCSAFESSFLCAACDRKWGAHCTYFETMQERKAGKLPYGEAYLPFHEMPDLQMAALTGTEEGGGDNCMTCDLSLEATPLSSTPVKRANTLGGRRLGVGKPS